MSYQSIRRLMNTESVVNRGYQKIEGAARAFNFDFRNKIVLDIGSSTGGFTQYALDHGAAKVIAIEKGTQQMKAPLRYDPRVELHEKTDILDVVADQQKGSESGAAISITAPDVILADVSFISLTKILKYAIMKLTRPSTQFLIMLKPQFEAREDQLHKGVVKNERIRREIIKDFELWLKQNGLIIVGKRDNDLKGRTGNRERFYHLTLAKR